MKNLFDYIAESTFSAQDFYKHNYVQDVIDKITKDGEIRLGARGETTHKFDDDIKKILTDEFDEIRSNGKVIDIATFNSIMKTHFDNHISWQKIFKGDFSGYANGLYAKNRGNAFEVEFMENWKTKYAQEIIDAFHLKPDYFDDCEVEHVGSKNSPRPLKMEGGSIVVGGSNTVGEDVSDIFVKDNYNNKFNINLSLKFGNTVTFVNAGVKRIFTPDSFKQYDVNGIYSAQTWNGVDGNKLLKMLGIENYKFGEVWSKVRTIKGEHVDVTDQLKNSEEFEKFIESAIGYDYILVHKINNNIHYYDLRTEKDLKKMLAGGVKKAEVCYGGISGKGKRVDVLVEIGKFKLKINIRDKQASMGNYPTHIMCDYTIIP